MAHIERHPQVADYFVQFSLAEIEARGGVADLVETGNIVILKDYRLDVDFEVLTRLRKSTEGIEDRQLKKTLKKLESPFFFEGEPPVERKGRLLFANDVRQAVFDVICRGDRELFDAAAKALQHSHDEALRIFGAAFPSYEPFRLVPSVRLTRTLFENLHWDNHSIDDDFHQARVFANLDVRPRIWHVSHRVPEMMRRLYREHDLGRFAGRDPNELLDYLNGDVLGGGHKIWMDNQPRHRIAWEPGEVWLGESRLISHQIYYGEAAMVYMWFMRSKSMADPQNRFNAIVEDVHREMAEGAAADAPEAAPAAA
ncbi:MAG TPA: hypothetical protein VIL42_03930 [Sphingomicrobium sp.]|jgi:hypothetical protein